KLTSTKVANRRGNFLFRQIAINRWSSPSIESFWRVKTQYHSVFLRNHHTTAASPKMLPECTDVISKFERLPKIAKPRNYKLHLKPFLKEFTFEGEVFIEMESTDYIKLYADDLKIKKATLKTSNSISDVTVDLNEKEECVTLRFPKEVRPGLAHLHVTYDGNLNDKMKGFYRSKYTNINSEDDYMATTQFEVEEYVAWILEDLSSYYQERKNFYPPPGDG
uniref:Aminopeptidase N-like N-terminal domain-containing protein n=1 Tax=Romanomermis culicivorax TaxID=13658 RepID=A0A915HUV1_ROMCU